MERPPLRILFVDNSHDVITSLKKMIQATDNDWYVRYAEGGVEAVTFLKDDRFDAVVTDIDMPEFNGYKLLKYIQKKHPEIIRIIYSGTLTKESVRKVAAYTHRFVAKPCCMEKLFNTIENTLFINRDLDSARIKKVLTKTNSIPSVPRVYKQLMEHIDEEEFSLKEAAHLLSSDIGMSANILKQINLLGRGEEIRTVEKAVMMLGLETIKAIAITSHIFSSMGGADIPYFSPEQLLRHSMLTAHFAREITVIETDDVALAESAFVAGILHDMGAIVFAQNFPSKYSDVLNRVYGSDRPLADVERNLIGISHGEIAAHLLALWGFPRMICSGIAYHEDPEREMSFSFTLVTALFIGSYFAHLFEDDRIYPETFIQDSEYIQQLNCGSRYELWHSRCRSIYDSLEM